MNDMTEMHVEFQVARVLATCTSDLWEIGLRSDEKIAAVLRARADLLAPRRPETEAAERAADVARIDALRNAAMKEDMEKEQRVKRFEQIERAYLAAINGRDPERIRVIDLLSPIFAAVPDMSTQEAAELLCRASGMEPFI